MNLGERRDKSREPQSLTQVHFSWKQKNKTLIPYIYK